MYLSIFKTLKYFSFFSYPPTFEEIYTFLPVKISKKKLKQELELLIKKKKLLIFDFKFLICPRYTIGEYGIKKLKVKSQKSKVEENNNSTIQQFNNYFKRYQESEKKLKNWRFRLYIKLLSFFPQIKLVGLSGSLAMMNAKKEDDIDLFIITAKNRLFTGRFIAIILAKILGIYRQRNNIRFTFYVSRYTNKVCLNLFFDERDLQVPKFKQSEYVAHEVLQMKPVINKDKVYERFLLANKWVFKIFPNYKKTNLKLKIKNQKLQLKVKNFRFFAVILDLAAKWLENILKNFQLKLINNHKTTEIITDFQLWFHPDDFEKKIKLT